MRNRQKSIHLAIGLLVGLFFVCHPAYGKVPDIIKTHPAFKGAPLPTYTSYQGKIELQGSTTINKTSQLQSADGVLVHEKFVNNWDMINAGEKSHYKSMGTKVLILGGLMGVESFWTWTKRVRNKLIGEAVRKYLLVSVSEVSGYLFPLAIGNRMSFEAEKLYSSKRNWPKSKLKRKSLNKKKYTFKVAQVLAGKEFDLSLPGKIYKIEMMEKDITEDKRKRIPSTGKTVFYYSDTYGIVVGKDRFSKGKRLTHSYLTSINGKPRPENPKQDGKTLVDKDYTLRHKVKAKGQLLHVYDAESMLIITDPNGKIVRDSSLQNRAAFATMIHRQWLSDYELGEYKRYQQLIGDFIKIEGMAQIALFFRDTAAKMMVDLGVAYMTGDPNQFTKQVARSTLKKAAKSSMKDTIKSMIKDPDSYLRAMAIAMLKKAKSELAEVERLARRMRGSILDYKAIEDFDTKVRYTYEKVVPAMVLIQGLRPGADVKLQVKNVLKTMESRLKDQLPGDFDMLSAAKKKSVYSKMGSVVDELYKRYKPYKAYQMELKKYKGLSNKGNSTRRAHYIEKIKYGNTVSKGYMHFSNK